MCRISITYTSLILNCKRVKSMKWSIKFQFTKVSFFWFQNFFLYTHIHISRLIISLSHLSFFITHYTIIRAELTPAKVNQFPFFRFFFYPISIFLLFRMNVFFSQEKRRNQTINKNSYSAAR